MKLHGFLLLIFCLCANICFAQFDLSLSIDAEEKKVELGQNLTLHLTFSNNGSEPFFFELNTSNFGKKYLNIEAESEDCKHSVGSVHFDRSNYYFQFDFVPLTPNRSVSTLISFGGYSNIVSLDIHTPGNYHLRVGYCSQGDQAEEDTRPIWRGCVNSNSIEVQFTQPDSKKVNTSIDRIIGCTKEPTCVPYDEAMFFSVIRSQVRVKELVSALWIFLQNKPIGYANTSIALAIANQKGYDSSELFARFAERPEFDVTTRDFYLNLSKNSKTNAKCN